MHILTHKYNIYNIYASHLFTHNYELQTHEWNSMCATE